VARLAAAHEMQGKGVGKLLLRFALQLALDMARDVGCVGVVVDAKEEAVAFYERYGFESFDVVQGGSNARPMPLAMFLPLGSIPPVSA
jgi:GNAT superfamily N-acetyltransferase